MIRHWINHRVRWISFDKESFSYLVEFNDNYPGCFFIVCLNIANATLKHFFFKSVSLLLEIDSVSWFGSVSSEACRWGGVSSVLQCWLGGTEKGPVYLPCFRGSSSGKSFDYSFTLQWESLLPHLPTRWSSGLPWRCFLGSASSPYTHYFSFKSPPGH